MRIHATDKGDIPFTEEEEIEFDAEIANRPVPEKTPDKLETLIDALITEGVLTKESIESAKARSVEQSIKVSDSK
ncbi:MAG: hypothetical protein V4563_17695 [Pseudomonadota bacterium]